EDQAGATVDRLADELAVEHRDAGEVAGGAVGLPDDEVAAVHRRDGVEPLGDGAGRLAAGDDLGGQRRVDVGGAGGDLQHVHDPRPGGGPAGLRGVVHAQAAVAGGGEGGAGRVGLGEGGEAADPHDPPERPAAGVVLSAVGDRVH